MTAPGSLLRSVLGLGLLSLLPVPSTALWPDAPARLAAATVFEISGVATSSRDGSPIPRCRISVTLATRGDESETERGASGGGRPGGTPGARGTRQSPAGAAEGAGLDSIGEALAGGAPGQRRAGRAQADPAGTETPEPVYADAHGRFTIVLPRAGAWRVAGAARGFRSQLYLQHGQFFAAVVVGAAVPRAEVQLHLDPDAALSGNVYDGFGEPVAGAQVQVQRRGGPSQDGLPVRWQTAGTSQTDDRGHYETVGLADGQYRILVQGRPWYAQSNLGQVFRGQDATASAGASAAAPPDPSLDVVYAPTWYPDAPDERDAQPVTLRPGEDREIDFHLLAIPAAHLAVPRAPAVAGDDGRNRPSPPPQLLRQEGGSAFFFGGQSISTSGPNGAWDIGGLAPGTYQVSVPGQGGVSRTVRVTVGQGSATTVALDDAQTSVSVEFKAEGAEIGDVRLITLTDAVSGQTFTSAGRGRGFGRGGPVQPEGEDEAETKSVEAPPGRYILTVATVMDTYLLSVSGTGAQVKGRTVEIAAGKPALTLHLAKGRATLTGDARCGGAGSGAVTRSPAALAAGPGAAAAEQSVQACVGGMVLLVPATLGEAGNLLEVRRAETATDGSFTMGSIVPGPYLLLALHGGWEVNWHDPVTLAQYLAHATPLELRPGSKQAQELEAQEP